MGTTNEKTFLSTNDVTVTQARLIVPGNTYAMSGITSVGTLKQTPSRKGPVFLLVCGFFGLLVGMGGSSEALGVGLLLMGLGALWFYLSKATYIVALRSASGQAEAFSSKDENYIRQVVDAINEAIIARG